MDRHNDWMDSCCDASDIIAKWKLTLRPNEMSYDYYKGFYEATRQFMQTFEKLIEAGALSGTKSNTNN